MKSKLLTSLLILLFAALLSSSACRTVKPVLKIGLVAPFEGRNRMTGYDVLYSARLAVREINESGGIDGYRIALVALDDSGDTESAIAAANTLAQDDAIIVAVGHWMEHTTQEVAAQYQANGVPFIEAAPEPFQSVQLDELPAEFIERYQQVAPFDEQPGPLAAAGYHSMQVAFEAIRIALEPGDMPTRKSISLALDLIDFKGGSGIDLAPFTQE